VDEELSQQNFNPSGNAEPTAASYRNGANGGNGTNSANGTHPTVTLAAAPPRPETSLPEPRAETAVAPEADSMYWQQNMAGQGREILWYNPPLPTSQRRRDELGAMVNSFAANLGERSPRGWFLQWTYQSRAAAAQEEAEKLEQESRAFLKAETERAQVERHGLEAEIARLSGDRARLETTLETQQERFAEITGRAGLIPDPGPVTVQSVEMGLQKETPSLERVAGFHGVSPAHLENGLGKKISTALFGGLAPLVSGFMLALCLGTLVGLVDMRALKRPELRITDYFPFILSALLGFVIVYLMGELYYTAIHALTRALEEREEGKRLGMLPSRYRAALGVATLLLTGAVVLGCSEVAAEAMGLRALHLTRIADLEIRGVTERELPMLLYTLIGLLISGPYMLYKSAKAWNHHDLHLRHAWLLHQQEEWVRDRRSQESVQAAFHQARVLEQTTARLELLKAHEEEARTRRTELNTVALSPEMRVRLDEARGAAVGEAARLHQMLEQLVDTYEPLPGPPLARAPVSR
jgi:hypothetical protein